jgi:uncharacterized protein
MSKTIRASRVLTAGEAEGEILLLHPPLSFWGGVDPQTGTVCDPRHPQYGQSLVGRIVAMRHGIGSSSGSSILLELMANGHAPAAIFMGEPDAILSLGAVVGREMGYRVLPVFEISAADWERLPLRARLTSEGILEEQ